MDEEDESDSMRTSDSRATGTRDSFGASRWSAATLSSDSRQRMYMMITSNLGLPGLLNAQAMESDGGLQDIRCQATR